MTKLKMQNFWQEWEIHQQKNDKKFHLTKNTRSYIYYLELKNRLSIIKTFHYKKVSLYFLKKIEILFPTENKAVLNRWPSDEQPIWVSGITFGCKYNWKVELGYKWTKNVIFYKCSVAKK